MNNKYLLLFLPLFSCLIWIAAISAGTHLRWFEFPAEDSDILFAFGCFIVSFALYFYILLILAVVFLSGVPFSTKLIGYIMGTDVLLLLLVTIFPGTGSGFIAFDTRDIVYLPAASVHFLLLHNDIIREGKIPDSRPPDKLIKALKSWNAEVRRKAVKALAKKKDPRAVESLIALLKNDEDWYVMNFAADALGRINDPRAIQPLVDFCKNGGKGGGFSNEEDAERALSFIDNPLAVPEFIAILEDKSLARLHSVAAKSLGKMGDSSAVEPLIAALAVKEINEEVIEALGEIGDPRGAVPIIAVLKKYKNDSLQVSWAAIEALGKIRNPVAVEPLIALLKDSDETFRSKAIEALGKIGDRRAVEPLVRVLKDTDGYMREVSAHALGNINDPRVVQPLIAALQKSNNSSFRRSVVWSLGQINDPRVAAVLITVLEQDENDEVRQMAAHWLGESGNSLAFAPLVAALKEGSKELRIASASSLGKLNDTRVIEPLVTAQNDSQRSVAWQATLSLVNFNDPKASAAVESFLNGFNLLKVAKNYDSIIRKGGEKNEFALIFALKRHGTQQMAQDFVTSKHWMLGEQGELWLKNHGLKPNRNAQPDAPEWGYKNRS